MAKALRAPHKADSIEELSFAPKIGSFFPLIALVALCGRDGDTKERSFFQMGTRWRDRKSEESILFRVLFFVL